MSPFGQTLLANIDPDLHELLPGYLARRHKDVETLRRALSLGDWRTIETLGHQIKGTAPSYGLNDLAEIARRLEEAAKNTDRAATAPLVDEFALFLAGLDL